MLRLVRVLHAGIAGHVLHVGEAPGRERLAVDLRAAQADGALGEILAREVVDRADDQLVMLLVDQADGAGLGLHHVADEFDGAIEELGQVARVGQHHRHVVDRRQLVDALAELVFLEAQPCDGVGQQEQELDGGRAVGVGLHEFVGEESRLARLDAGPARQLAQPALVDDRRRLGDRHADGAQPLVVDHDGRDVLSALAVGALLQRVLRLHLRDRPLLPQELGRRRGLRQQVALGIRDLRLDVGHGRKAILDLLQRRQVHEVGKAEIVWVGSRHSGSPKIVEAARAGTSLSSAGRGVVRAGSRNGGPHHRPTSITATSSASSVMTALPFSHRTSCCRTSSFDASVAASPSSVIVADRLFWRIVEDRQVLLSPSLHVDLRIAAVRLVIGCHPASATSLHSGTYFLKSGRLRLYSSLRVKYCPVEASALK